MQSSINYIKSKLFGQLLNSIDEKFGSNREKEARDYVMAGVELGLYGEDIDIEQVVKVCAKEGLSLKKLLDEIAAQPRGLPHRKVEKP